MPNSSPTPSPSHPTEFDSGSTYDAWYSALANSHQRLAKTVETLSPEAFVAPSYCSEWSIAQVLSHLGSGAEIFSMILDAGLKGDPAPGPDQFGPLWERWNAKSPEGQVVDALSSDTAFLDQLAALDESQRSAWHLEFFGREQDIRDLLRMRLGEHEVHTWDIAVTRDPNAVIAHDAVALLVDVVDQVANRTGKPSEQPMNVKIVTRDPKRVFALHVNSDEASLRSVAESGSDDLTAVLDIPSEALIRLVYGRLDPDHSPTLFSEDADVDDLRSVFPGF